MRSTSLIGIGALTTAALLGTCFTGAANAAVSGGYGNGGGNNNEHHGYVIVEEEGLSDGTLVTADCPNGGKVTGGGVKLLEAAPPVGAITATYPTSSGDGWVGAAEGAPPPRFGTITVYAICTKVGDDHKNKY